MKMRLSLVLVLAGLVLGGMSACSDHDPSVVFKTDAAGDAKISPQDSGVNADAGNNAVDAVIAIDNVGPAGDVPSAVDQAGEVSPTVDGSNAVDVNVVEVDSNKAVDGPASIDGPALDVSTSATLDGGVDASASHDAEGVEG